MVNLILTVCLVLLLGTLATFAGQWLNLPRPSLQTPQLAVGDARSINDSPVRLKMLVANPDHLPLLWVPKQPGSTISNNQWIHFTVGAAKPSYVYLIYKGRWSKKATLIFPDSTSPKNYLPAGMKIHSSAFQVEPPGDRETVLMVASEQPVEWLKYPAFADAVFSYAVQELSKEKEELGLVLSAVPLDENGKAKKNSGDDNALLFISAMSYYH
jgi:hypothetical protein